MAINYLTNFINKLDETYQQSEGFNKALVQGESKDFFETKAYVQKLIEIRTKLRKKRVMKFGDLIDMITDIVKDENVSRLYGIEKAINFVDEFEEAKPLIVSLMKKIDKDLRACRKSEIFEKLGIKLKVARSNRYTKNFKFKDLFAKESDAKREGPDRDYSECWGDRFPYWTLTLTMHIPNIRIISSVNSDKQYDFEIPYGCDFTFKISLMPEKIDSFIITEVGNMQKHIDNVEACMKTLFVENRERTDTAMINMPSLRMTDLDDFRKFRGLVHPYMSRPSVHASNTSNRCYGDMQGDIDDALSSIDIERLGVLLFTWLSNYTIGYTTPLNDINNFMMGGIKEEWGKGVSNYPFPQHYQEICWNEVMGNVKLCDAAKCLARSYCDRYIENSTEIPDEAEFELNELNVMNRYSNWFNEFNTLPESLKSFIKQLFIETTDHVEGARIGYFNDGLNDYLVDNGYDPDIYESMYMNHDRLEQYQHLYWYFCELPNLNEDSEIDSNEL